MPMYMYIPTFPRRDTSDFKGHAFSRQMFGNLSSPSNTPMHKISHILTSSSGWSQLLQRTMSCFTWYSSTCGGTFLHLWQCSSMHCTHTGRKLSARNPRADGCTVPPYSFSHTAHHCLYTLWPGLLLEQDKTKDEVRRTKIAQSRKRRKTGGGGGGGGGEGRERQQEEDSGKYTNTTCTCTCTLYELVVFTCTCDRNTQSIHYRSAVLHWGDTNEMYSPP